MKRTLFAISLLLLSACATEKETMRQLSKDLSELHRVVEESKK